MKGNSAVVLGYARVSTDNQLENYSIDEQIERLQAYCNAKDWTLLKTYVDGGYSGGNTERPALQQMLEAIRAKKIDAVVVYKLDRLSRSQKDTLTLIEDEFLSHGTDFVSINENFDTSTPFGRAMIGILSVFAQLEKDQITERFTMGRIGRGKAGYFHGGGSIPTGYDYIDGMLVVNEYEGIQVREVFDAFLSGKSINAIYQAMSKRYVTKWSAAKVRNVLMNSLYTGKVKFLGQEYAGIHAPIIPESTYESANRLLHSASRENQKSPAQKTPFRANFLLSSLVYCENCGARYSGNHGYYKCYSRSKSSKKFIIDPTCRNTNWRIEALDAVAAEQVKQLISSPKALKEIIQHAGKDRGITVSKDNLRKRIAAIDVQLDKLIELYQVSAIPMAALTRKVHELSAEKSSLQEQVDAESCAPAADLSFSAADDYTHGFAHADLDQQRILLRGLIERIDVNGHTVKIKWRI